MTSDSYTAKPFPPARQFFADGMEFGGRRHCIHGLIEVDVTIPRRRLQELKQKTGESLSFTGFLVYCGARAIEQNKQVHAYRDWRNRLIVFDDVDVYVPVDKPGEALFSHVIIRGANRKSVAQIHQEIRQVQAAPPLRTREASSSGATPSSHASCAASSST